MSTSFRSRKLTLHRESLTQGVDIGTFAGCQVPIYSLGTWESYGLTAQHMQDCPIFIQLNYVHNNKEIRCCHFMINSPATRWHWGFHFLFLNSAILHSCNFGHKLFISVNISFNLCHPSIISVGLYWFVSIGMHLGIF